MRILSQLFKKEISVPEAMDYVRNFVDQWNLTHIDNEIKDYYQLIDNIHNEKITDKKLLECIDIVNDWLTVLHSFRYGRYK